jgi:hypothetical protein
MVHKTWYSLWRKLPNLLALYQTTRPGWPGWPLLPPAVSLALPWSAGALHTRPFKDIDQAGMPTTVSRPEISALREERTPGALVPDELQRVGWEHKPSTQEVGGEGPAYLPSRPEDRNVHWSALRNAVDGPFSGLAIAWRSNWGRSTCGRSIIHARAVWAGLLRPPPRRRDLPRRVVTAALSAHSVFASACRYSLSSASDARAYALHGGAEVVGCHRERR